VINLVDNAVKYSPPSAEIAVRVAPANRAAALEVCDHGPGIAADRAARIFDRFYRAAPGLDRGGMGLGLSIAKCAVEANRGELTWQPRPGGGSIFRITLPYGVGIDAGRVMSVSA